MHRAEEIAFHGAGVTEQRPGFRCLLQVPTLCVAALLFLACGKTASTDQAPANNLLIVVIDTLRSDHLRPYGYDRDTAPTLSRLAAEGAVLDGISPTSWTKPAVASLLTGLHPLRHQAIAFSDGLPESVTTLAEVLSRHGFLSVGVSGNSWTTEPAGFSQGFERLLLIQPDDLSKELATAEEVNRAVAALLPTLREPYFLYVHYVDPHLPYDPGVAWDGGPLPPDLARRAPITAAELMTAFPVPRDPELVRQSRELYDGEIRQVDIGVAELLSMIRQAPISGSTLLVITSDHGEEFEEHGLMGHGNTLHEEVVRIPLIFHLPGGIPAGARLGEASLLDVFPTVLELLGLTYGAKDGTTSLDGESRAAELREARSRRNTRRTSLLHLDYQNGAALALRGGGSKLILAKAPYTKALYDLHADPEEQRNLWAEQIRPVLLERLGAEIADAHNSFTRRVFRRRPWLQGPEGAAHLRAIGYLGHAGEKLEPREIPRRITAPDLRPDGLLGWEPLHDVVRCVELGDAGHSRYLVGGWHEIEPLGRWTAGTAQLLLAATPRSESELVVRGVSFRTDSFHLEARINGSLVQRARIKPGEFELRGQFKPSATRPWVQVSLTANPLLAPFSQGPEARTLGALISSVCLVPTAPAD